MGSTGYGVLRTFHFCLYMPIHSQKLVSWGGVVPREEGQCLFYGSMALAPASGTSLPL